MYEIRNARYNHLGTIDVEVNSAKYGWIPTTADPNDIVEASREIYALALQGYVAPFVPFTTEQLRANFPTITPRQFWIAAASIGVSKQDVLDVVATMTDEAERTRTQIEILEATLYERTNPYIDDLSGILGVSGEELDALWLWASEV